MNEHDYALRDASMAAFVDSYFKARPQLMRTRHEECLVEAGFKAAWKPDQTERAEKAEAELARLQEQEQEQEQEPVAEYDGVEFSRYTLRWINGQLPVGTKFYAEPVFDRAAEENRFQAEELEALHMCLRDYNVPVLDENGKKLSAWGRVVRFVEMQAIKPAASAVPDGDDFNGTTPHLIQCMEALVRLDADGVLVPHGIGRSASRLLSAAANRLRKQTAPSVLEEWKDQILAEFPLLDDEGLCQEKYHCEWAMQQDRKRLHALLQSAEVRHD